MYGAHAPLSAAEAPLSGGQAALVGLAALAVVIIPFLWPLVEHFNAMAHEGAHAVVGSVMGFGIKSIKLSMENRGATDYYRAPNAGPRRTLTRFVGQDPQSRGGEGGCYLIHGGKHLLHDERPGTSGQRLHIEIDNGGSYRLW